MKLYDCHNKPRSAGYWAQDGSVLVDGALLRRAVWIEDHMSQDCRYDKQQEDARCADCERINDLGYSPK